MCCGEGDIETVTPASDNAWTYQVIINIAVLDYTEYQEDYDFYSTATWIRELHGQNMPTKALNSLANLRQIAQ